MKQKIPVVTIYTDGSCFGNPGPGGYGAILEYGKHRVEISGGTSHTTSNRMELTAAIMALERLKKTCVVHLYSDSRYLVDAINRGRAVQWKKHRWMRTEVDPVTNSDLWKRLLALCARHEVHFHWVKGHANDARNNRCDELATRESRNYQRRKRTCKPLKMS